MKKFKFNQWRPSLERLIAASFIEVKLELLVSKEERNNYQNFTGFVPGQEIDIFLPKDSRQYLISNYAKDFQPY